MTSILDAGVTQQPFARGRAVAFVLSDRPSASREVQLEGESTIPMTAPLPFHERAERFFPSTHDWQAMSQQQRVEG